MCLCDESYIDFFFFKQKTAYEMRISDWSSDVCSSDLLHQHHSAHGLIQALSPIEPVTLVRPHAARRAARFFIERFPGTTMYAVKANPSPDLLRVLRDSGVTHYDVASIAEVRLVARTLPGATLCFMHQIGRASCRARECKYVSISGVGVQLKKKK